MRYRTSNLQSLIANLRRAGHIDRTFHAESSIIANQIERSLQWYTNFNKVTSTRIGLCQGGVAEVDITDLGFSEMSSWHGEIGQVVFVDVAEIGGKVGIGRRVRRSS